MSVIELAQSVIDKKVISIRQLWYYVNHKTNRVVNALHVLTVVNLLIEELVQDLKDNKEIKIFNFATISLEQMKSRPYIDIATKTKKMSKPNKKLTFKLNKNVKMLIFKNVDLDKTFPKP